MLGTRGIYIRTLVGTSNHKSDFKRHCAMTATKNTSL